MYKYTYKKLVKKTKKDKQHKNILFEMPEKCMMSMYEIKRKF